MKKMDQNSPSTSSGLHNAASSAVELPLDFNELFFRSPHSTFVMRAQNNSVDGRDSVIKRGDLLIVDRAVTPSSNSFVVMDVDGEMKIGELCGFKNSLQDSFNLWGTVIYRVQQL